MTPEDARPALRAAEWAKSSFSSSTGNCVSTARVPGYVGVTDTKEHPDPAQRTMLVFTEAEWAAFSAGVMAGEL